MRFLVSLLSVAWEGPCPQPQLLKSSSPLEVQLKRRFLHESGPLPEPEQLSHSQHFSGLLSKSVLSLRLVKTMMETAGHYHAPATVLSDLHLSAQAGAITTFFLQLTN